MAKTRTNIDIADLERQAKGTLARLPWFDPCDLPSSHQNAAGYAALLKGVLKDGTATDKNYLAARQSVERWQAATALRQKAEQLYWDPKVRALAGNDEGTMRWFWEHPQEALKQLAAHSVEHPTHHRDGPLAETLAALGEALNFDADHEDYSSGLEPTAQAVQTSGTSSGARDGTPALPSKARAPSPGKQPVASNAASANAEWARAVEKYERSHPAEDDPNGPLPETYFEEESDHANESESS